MTAVAAPTFVCEVCSTPLRYRGGPHQPRWCAKHRKKYNANYRAHQAVRDRATAGNPDLACERCKSRLLRPSDTRLCNFCAIELGLLDEADLMAGADRMSTTVP